ncbi:MAG: metallophosphoesterase [Acidobacteria bacterium]|nr:metallophosphoesterase [Acidobacteriota bacterium]
MGGKTLDLVHLSDFHFTGSDMFDAHVFNKGVAMVNSLDPDLVVFTGDVTDRGLRGEYQLARTFISQFAHPVHYLIGNHDARNVGHGLFEEYISPRVVRHEGDDFILLAYDSTIPDMNQGRFGEFLIREMKADLEAAPPGKIKVMAFHHHLLPVPFTGRERGVLIDAGTVLEHILDHEVEVVLTGHKHYPNVYQIENTIVSNAGTFSCEKIRAGAPHSFNTIRIRPDGRVTVRINYIEDNYYTEFVKERRPTHVRPKGEPYLRIVHVSDTHFTDAREFCEDTFTRALYQINALEPDIFIHAGDVTHQGLPEEVDMAVEWLADVEAGVRLFTLGSHDLRHTGPDVFRMRYRELMKVEPPDRLLLGENYTNLINIYDSEKVRIALINSSIYDSTKGHIGRRKLSMALDALTEVNHKPRMVAFHHHIIPIPRTKEAHLIEDAGNVLRGLVDAGVDMILTGHRHRSFCAQVEDTVVVNSNTLSSRRPVQECRNSFNIIDITTDGVAVVRERCVATGEDAVKGVYRLPFGGVA